MRPKYLHQDHAARLHDGICFYDGVPSIIYVNGNRGELHALNGSSVNTIEIEGNEKLDISAPVLGYVNSTHNCMYIMRNAGRRYKQTLTTVALSGTVPLGRDRYHDDFDDTRSLTVRSALYSQDGHNMLINKYPSLDTVLTELRKVGSKVASRAFHRDVAIARDSFGILHVFYKVDEVGILKDRTVEIPHSEHAWIISKHLGEFDWKVV